MDASISGKRVLVIGLGLHGGAIGTIQWLAQQGAVITVTDKKTEQELADSIKQLQSIPNITYKLGGHDAVDVTQYDMIIRNPGVPRTSELIQTAKKFNIPVAMDSGLFFQYCPSNNIIGITGSKGKTTASTAISAVLTSLEPTTVTVGVDGVSPLGKLASLTPPTGRQAPALSQNVRGESPFPVVFELSSWRLEALQELELSPHIAVVTSIYKDHLNTYASYEEYIDTKKQIIRNQQKDDIAILNADDEILRTWKGDVQGALYWFSLAPLPEDQQGIWVELDEVYVSLDGDIQPICVVSDIPHRSLHELRNKLPAILIALLHGATQEKLTEAIRAIPLLDHRLQLVRTINGVDYINDTAATMPDATIAALTEYGTKPLILIIGGSDKALEFEDLARTIAQTNTKHIVWLPGTATDRMKATIQPFTEARSHDSSSMNEAVQIATKLAEAGDTVLLSPGATSFGLFLHEFDRGNAFIKAVQDLQQ